MITDYKDNDLRNLKGEEMLNDSDVLCFLLVGLKS